MKKHVQTTLGFFTEGHGPGRKVHPITQASTASRRRRLAKPKTKLKLTAEPKESAKSSIGPKKLTPIKVGDRVALVSPVPVDHSKLYGYSWSDAESAQALADAINSWKGEEVVLFGGGAPWTTLARVKYAEVHPPKTVPPLAYDGWAVRMVLEYLDGDSRMFRRYNHKTGEYTIGEFDPWYGFWRIAKVEAWQDEKP